MKSSDIVTKTMAYLIEMAEYEQEDGGSLIPFKKRMTDCGETGIEFRNRQIAALEIPTYENMKKVYFYDVLLKLSF